MPTSKKSHKNSRSKSPKASKSKKSRTSKFGFLVNESRPSGFVECSTQSRRVEIPTKLQEILPPIHQQHVEAPFVPEQHRTEAPRESAFNMDKLQEMLKSQMEINFKRLADEQDRKLTDLARKIEATSAVSSDKRQSISPPTTLRVSQAELAGSGRSMVDMARTKTEELQSKIAPLNVDLMKPS